MEHLRTFAMNYSFQAEGFNGDSNPVVAVKGCKLQEFNGGECKVILEGTVKVMHFTFVGRTVSVLFSSIVTLNPDIPESHELKGWWV